jgi:4-amino-4-deoxychorismate lyase
MSTRSWINGEQHLNIAVVDRGLQYGDGLFETLAAIEGNCPWFPAHYQRLVTGCERLAIPVPDKQLLLREVNQAAAGQYKAVIKILLTSGRGGRGYRRPDRLEPSRIVMRYDWPEYPDAYWQDGVALKLCQTRLGCNPALAGIKHLNRLEQVMARNEWQNSEYADGLMCDTNGKVIEGTMSNVYLVRDNTLHTPITDNCGVAGVMRRWVLDNAHKFDIEVHEAELSVEDVKQANEVMLSNSLIGLWPVKTFESSNYQPGPVYRALLKYLLKEYPVINAPINAPINA